MTTILSRRSHPSVKPQIIQVRNPMKTTIHSPRAGTSNQRPLRSINSILGASLSFGSGHTAPLGTDGTRQSAAGNLGTAHFR